MSSVDLGGAFISYSSFSHEAKPANDQLACEVLSGKMGRRYKRCAEIIMQVGEKEKGKKRCARDGWRAFHDFVRKLKILAKARPHLAIAY